MRIKYFLYFLLLASPLVAQSPLSAIDWLSKENSKFQRNTLEEKNIDVEKANEIQVSTLNSNEYQAIGLSTNLCYWNSYNNLEEFKL